MTISSNAELAGVRRAGRVVKSALDTRWVVRHDAMISPGDVLTDDGDTYSIRGVSEIGRRRYMELLARSTG